MTGRPEDPLAHEPFRHRALQDGRVQLYFEGRVVETLKGRAAARFLERVDGADAAQAQQLMARATKNFKRGNEREGKRRGR